MERLITAPMRDFRAVCEAARQRERYIGDALYPPRCGRRTGRLTFRTLGDGSTELCVEPTAYEGRVESVRALFESRSLIFDDADAVHDFCHGPLAEAFREPPRERAETLRQCDARALATCLSDLVGDQPEAAERLAQLAAAGLGRTHPSHPISMVLVGPHGLGKASMVRALPSALEAIGCPTSGLLEIDSSSLTSETRAGAILGFPHMSREQSGDPPLVAALRTPRPIILVRGIEKANPIVLLNVVGPLLEEGAAIAPNGSRVAQPSAVIVLTTALRAGDLTDALGSIPVVDRRARVRLCRAHLRESEFLADIVDAVEAIAPFVPLEADAQLRAAERSIRVAAAEHGLTIAHVDPVLCATTVDLAAQPLNLRTLLYAARDVLGPVFATSHGVFDGGVVDLAAGPPPQLRVPADEDLRP